MGCTVAEGRDKQALRAFKLEDLWEENPQSVQLSK